MLTGSCLCGQIRFRIDGEIGSISFCHCRSCRKAQGTAFVTNAPVARNSFTLTAGESLVAAYESSPGKLRCFCRNCGSPVYSWRREMPDVIRIRLGTLDSDPGARPVLHAWVSEKAPWFEITDELPRFEGGLPPEPRG